MSTAPARSAPPPPPPGEDEDSGASASTFKSPIARYRRLAKGVRILMRVDERLLAAAKSDNEDMLDEALAELEDINFADGMGNTALHYAIIHASTGVLETILSHETCDVDPKNRLSGDTPLHIAVRNKWEDAEGLRLFLVASLLEAGADTSYNEKPIDLIPQTPNPDSDEAKIREIIRHVEAENAVAAKGDVVDEDNEVFDPNDIASDSD